MSTLGGAYAALALVLGIGGAMKVRDPAPTVRAMRAIGLPSGLGAVRVAACVEIVIACDALVAGGRPVAVAVSLSYLAFAAFVVIARARGGALSSCGCFGKLDTPPTVLHIVIDLGAAALAALVAAAGGRAADGLLAELARQPMAGVPFLALVVLTGALVLLAFTLLPQALAETRR